MPASVPAWPAWACFTAMMLAHAPYGRSETPTPALTVQLMDLARLAREARLAAYREVRDGLARRIAERFRPGKS